MHPILDATLGWLAALFATILFVGVGRAFGRVIGERDPGLGPAFAMGSGVLGTLLISLAFGAPSGTVARSLVWTEVLLLVFLCLPIAVWGLRGVTLPRVPWSSKIGPVPMSIAAVLFAIWLAPHFVQSLVPDTDWDSAMYHRPTAMRIIEQGAMHTDPYRAQLNFPAFVPLLYSGFMACDLPSALTPLNLIVLLLTIFTVFDIAKTHFDAHAALWATGLICSTNIVLELASDQRSDGFLGLYFLTAAHTAFAIFRDPSRVRLLPFLGMSMGLAVGTKLTGLLAVGLFGGFTVVWLFVKRPPRFGRWLALGILLVFVPGFFWLFRNAVELNNPVYPFPDQLLYYNTEGELRPFYPDFEPLYERATKPPDSFLADPGTQKEPGTILNLVDVFADPERYQNKLYHWLQPLLFLALLLPFVDRRPRHLWIAAMSVLTFLGLGVRAHLVRYGIPAFPLLAIATGVLLAHPKVHRWPIVSWLALAILFGAVGLGQYWLYNDKLPRLAPFEYLTGGTDKTYEWRVRRGYNRDTRSTWLAHEINLAIQDGRMKNDDTILMIGEGKFELIRCNSIPDVSAEANMWLAEYLNAGGDYPKLRQNLRRFGVTHMLFNGGQLDWAITNLEMDSPLQQSKYLRFAAWHALEFMTRYGTQVFGDQDRSVWLFALRD